MKSPKLRWCGNVLVGIGFVLLISALVFSVRPRSYGAKVLLKVENEPIDVISTKIQSRDVLDAAIRNLNLTQKWAGQGSAPLDISVAWSKLKRRVQIRQPHNTSLIEIEVRSHDPDEAAGIANAIADAYRTQELERRRPRDLEDQWVKLSERTKMLEAAIEAQPNDVGPDQVRKRGELESLKKQLENLTSQIIHEKVDQAISQHTIVEIIDPATPPVRPTFPSPRLLAGIWFLALVTIGAGVLLRQS